MRKLTENGDISFTSTGNNLLDILFMTAYFEKHLRNVKIGKTDREKLFSMFVRDPRFGLGRRDLGREMMIQSDVSCNDIVKAGRFDDLYLPNLSEARSAYLLQALIEGNELAKKWMPRLNSKNNRFALAFCDAWGISKKKYRNIIKCDTTTEYKLSYEKDEKHPLVKDINFEQVPSLAMIKYFKSFLKRPDTTERFKKYLDSVKKGEKKLNISTTTVYDIYKNRENIDADLFFDKLEKIKVNCLPILDTSGSMFNSSTDAIGKAVSIAHYLAKCSTYLPDYVMSFSKQPKLMKLSKMNHVVDEGYYGRLNYSFGNSDYCKELNSMYTGDVGTTDFAKVMNVLKQIKSLPEYIVVLSDMEFNEGSSQSKDELEKLWKENDCTTKIVWWNFNSKTTTVPEIDKNGNIYISGYSPQMLKYLDAGFDGNMYLDKLLDEYVKNIRKA